jgi:hypothetical protein
VGEEMLRAAFTNPGATAGDKYRTAVEGAHRIALIPLRLRRW